MSKAQRRAALVTVALVLAMPGAWSLAADQKQRAKPEGARPAFTMDDGFEYALLEFGVGRVPDDPRRELLRGRPDPRRFLWIKMRLTNTARTALASPRYWQFGFLRSDRPTDNFGNRYPVTSRSLSDVSTTTGRYKPAESTIHLLLIPAEELIDSITELRIGPGESGFMSRYHFFALSQPLARVRDFDPDAPDPDPADLPAKARRQFLPPPK